MWKRSFQVLKSLNWLGLTPTVHPFQPPPSSLLWKKKKKPTSPFSSTLAFFVSAAPCQAGVRALNESKCPVDGFHRWSVEIGRIGLSHRPFLGIQQKPPNKSTKIPKITKGKCHLSFTLGLWGNISLASLLPAFTGVNTREVIHISLSVKGRLQIRKQLVVPLSPSCWMAKLTNTGDILRLAKWVRQTLSWPIIALMEYTYEIPLSVPPRMKWPHGALRNDFYFYLFLKNQWNTTLSTNADRSSSERLGQTKRASDLVWGHFRVSDQWLRMFSLKAHREKSPTSSRVCKLHCIIPGANIEFKWLSCFDSLIIQVKGLAGKKDSVPNSRLWIILFLHFLPVSHLWIILVWKPIITEFHVTKTL